STTRPSTRSRIPPATRFISASWSTRTADSGRSRKAAPHSDVHDLKLLRENIAALRDGMRRRGKLDTLGPVIDRAEVLDRERRALLAQIAELERLQYELPNIPLADVPEGGEEANVVIRSWGEPRSHDGVRPHWEVGEQLGILDLPRGAKIAGSGFIVFRGRGARLVRALIAFFLDLATREHGYEEIWVPSLVNRRSMTGTGQLPKFEDDAYVTADDLFLIPTAEVPVTNLYRDEVLDAGDLPMALTA